MFKRPLEDTEKTINLIFVNYANLMISANIYYGSSTADSYIPTDMGLPVYFPEDGGLTKFDY